MFGNLFNPQNSFWQTVDHLSDLLILSLLWLLCSLPLVTAGAAAAALYDAAAHCRRARRRGERTPADAFRRGRARRDERRQRLIRERRP